MKRSDIAVILARTSLFSEISHLKLKEIASYIRLMRGGAGEKLYVAGEPSTGMFVVADGTCEVIFSSEKKENESINSLIIGDTFGELSLLLRGDRVVSIIAKTDVVLFHLSKIAFERMKKENAEIGIIVLSACANRLAKTLHATKNVLKSLLIQELEK